uniref:Aromatic-L-amino-acid decarboxylase n=1 Tax=Schistocephalus solidus TaxID=70667 RepID=A0A183SJP5_SCHSO
LKIWMVLRSYGVEGVQKHIRRQVEMAHYLERIILEDGRFEIISQVVLGIVCFRLKQSNRLTRLLHKKIEADGRFLLVMGSTKHPKELFYIRVAICYQFPDNDEYADVPWKGFLGVGLFYLAISPSQSSLMPQSPVRAGHPTACGHLELVGLLTPEDLGFRLVLNYQYLNIDLGIQKGSGSDDWQEEMKQCAGDEYTINGTQDGRRENDFAESSGQNQQEHEYYQDMRTYCKRAVDVTAAYLEGVAKHRVFPEVEPGYLRPLLPAEAPQNPESWDAIFDDVNNVLMPGAVHWHHPHFHAYFMTANSYAALCADIMSNAIGGLGITWATSPVNTELEVVMVDWLAKALNLPEFFLSHTQGGGVIHSSPGESTFICMLAARNAAIAKYQVEHPVASNFQVMEKLVAYYSDQAHATVERAGRLSMLRVRALPSNKDFELDGETLRKAVEEDLTSGLIPFFCTATLGTTGTCSYDRLTELGPVCQQYDIWLHADAAYAGSALICPEFRSLMPGLEYLSSFTFNPHKWLHMNFDLSVLWLKDSQAFVTTFSVDATYLQHSKLGKMPDFRHVAIAHILEGLLIEDGRFEIVGKVTLGLVCFRLEVTSKAKHCGSSYPFAFLYFNFQSSNELTRLLHERIESDGRLHMVTSRIKRPVEKLYIRVSINYQFITEDLIRKTFDVICELATEILAKYDLPDTAASV